MEKIHKLFRSKVQVITDLDPVNEECPVCNFLARDSDDIESIINENACTECTLNFKYENPDGWVKGERPAVAVARSRMNIFINEV